MNLIGDSEQSNTHTFGIQMVIVINAYVNRVDAVCKDKVNAFIQDCLCKTKRADLFAIIQEKQLYVTPSNICPVKLNWAHSKHAQIFLVFFFQGNTL